MDVAEIVGQFNMITLIDVLVHIPDEVMEDFLEVVLARLASNGALVVMVPTTNIQTNRKHYRHYNLRSLKDALE